MQDGGPQAGRATVKVLRIISLAGIAAGAPCPDTRIPAIALLNVESFRLAYQVAEFAMAV
jgi:hypothetical protein